MQKLNKNSLDLTKENISKLKQIFPDIFCEDKIDFEKLKENLGEFIEESEEKYQFNWFGKKDSNKIALTPTSATLRVDKNSSKSWNETENVYIEGDNLEVLKVIQKAYYKKVKMIYIDPPYNRNADVIYEDDYSDNLKNYLSMTGQIDEEGNPLTTNTEKSGRKHSNWLNMIYPRLKVARNLLKADGVIFVSIDDNEVANLRKVMDEIFGEENFVGILSVENNPKGRKNSKFISVSSEYCVVYAKNKEISYFIENIPKNMNDMSLDENGNYIHNSGKRVLVGENSFNKEVLNFNSEKHYSVYYNKVKNKLIIKNENSINEINEFLTDKGYKRFISFKENKFVDNTYTFKKLLELFENNALIFTENKIFEKNFNNKIRIKSILKNIFYDALINNKKEKFKIDLKTTSANELLKKIFGIKDLFKAPKNVNYIKLLITLLAEKDFLVLDFFSGSATTANAVMELNAEDGGNRKFILVQIPEPTDEKSEAYKAGYKNICEIGKERIRRAGEIINEKLKMDNGKLDIGFKVFKLDSTNIIEWDTNVDDLKKDILESGDVIKSDRSDEDLLYEILLKQGIALNSKIEIKEILGKKLYIVENGKVTLFFDEINIEIAKQIVELLKDKKDDLNILFLKDKSFSTSEEKVNIKELFKQMNIFDRIVTF